MQQKGVVVLSDPQTGRIALLVEDMTYLLAEQLDGQQIGVNSHLTGVMNVIGIESLSGTDKENKYTVFIIAYGLSREAVYEEFC